MIDARPRLRFAVACYAVGFIVAAVTLVTCSRSCCAAPRSPVAYRVVLPDGMTWWGPTCDVAQARARWYCDPSWRRAENIPALGYGR